MKAKAILVAALICVAGVSAGCSKANQNGANQNANLAQVNSPNANGQAPVAPGDNPTTSPGNVPTGPDPTQGVTPSANTHPAADNSDVNTVMDKDGNVTETRSFKNNKYISKVVVLTETKNGKLTKTVTVYDLKGNAHKLPEAQADSVMQANGDELARNSGMPVPKGTDTVNQVTTGGGNRTVTDKAKDQINQIKKRLP